MHRTVMKRSYGLVMMMVAGLAAPALADLPPALDRAPKDAAVVIAVRNFANLRAGVENLMDKFEPGSSAFLGELDMLFDAEGFKKDGSGAVVLLGDPSAEDYSPETNMVVILPVTDWAKFSAAMGGEAGKKEAELPNLSPGVLARDIGGGFIALGPEPTLQSFKEVSGQIESHKAALGASGSHVADTADLFVVVNAPKFASKIEKGIEEGKEQAAMMAAMAAQGNPDAQKQIEAAMKGLQNMARDAQSFAIGLTINKTGVIGDLALHFKDGSESAKTFTHKGSTAGLAGSLPQMPYLAAMALDTTHPVVRDMLKTMAAMQQATNPGMSMTAAQIEKLDGMAFVLGSNPALLSTGLFAKAMSFEKSGDPTALLASKREAMSKMSMNENGVKVEATLTPDAVDIAGQKVDRLKTKIEIDPAGPAAQAQQFMTIFTGTSGEMGGFITKTKNGVLTTMSANTDMMTKAIKAQGGEGALSADADFKAISELLPPNRAFEGFLGVKGLADTAAGIMQLVGMPMPVEVKDETPPIAFGVTASSGGIGARIVFPTKVVDTFADIAKKLNEAQHGEDAPMEDDKAGDRRKPRF